MEESAIVQTFPLGMRFAGRKPPNTRKSENAVPPDLAFIIGRSVFFQLNGRSAPLALQVPAPEQSAFQSEFAL